MTICGFSASSFTVTSGLPQSTDLGPYCSLYLYKKKILHSSFIHYVNSLCSKVKKTFSDYQTNRIFSATTNSTCQHWKTYYNTIFTNQEINFLKSKFNTYYKIFLCRKNLKIMESSHCNKKNQLSDNITTAHNNFHSHKAFPSLFSLNTKKYLTINDKITNNLNNYY